MKALMRLIRWLFRCNASVRYWKRGGDYVEIDEPTADENDTGPNAIKRVTYTVRSKD